MNKFAFWFLLSCLMLGSAWAADTEIVFEAGHASLRPWLLPETVPHPADNPPTPERVALGKKLFFDPRLSGDGNMSCATCHNPALGWSDALPTARGAKSRVLGRASPTVINAGYNTIQMWDGRAASLEDQAMGPMLSPVEMAMDPAQLFARLNANAGYRALFAAAYPGEAIDAATFSKAIAAFERTAVSRDSSFDRWLQGDSRALTAQQVEGFRLFVGKGNCAACHQPPNFTDNGFHNVGLASAAAADADPGRYAQKPVKRLLGAFKTPTLRDIGRTAPYFHDGSAPTLAAAVDHYDQGGVVKAKRSPNMKELALTGREKGDLLAFLQSLTSPPARVDLPELPLD